MKRSIKFVAALSFDLPYSPDKLHSKQMAELKIYISEYYQNIYLPSSVQTNKYIIYTKTVACGIINTIVLEWTPPNDKNKEMATVAIRSRLPRSPLFHY